MNNKRLSTNSSTKVDRELLYAEISCLLSGPSNYEVRENGSVFIKSLNRCISLDARDKIMVEVQDENGNIINKFDSITSCARFYGISRSTTHRRLRNNEPVVVFIANQPFYIKIINQNNDFLDSQEVTSLPVPCGPLRGPRAHGVGGLEKTPSNKTKLKINTKRGNPVNIYEKCSSEGLKLIGSFVSIKRAGLFLGVSGSTIIKYINSGAIYKDRYKFSSR